MTLGRLKKKVRIMYINCSQQMATNPEVSAPRDH